MRVVPRKIAACALLSPFDPVVWNRDRAHRLFGFHYRIEIYTPQPKRIYGYYVLPILWGDSVVGRLDMKADRQGGALLVQASFTEPGVPAGPLADDLAPELHAMAGWLGLGEVDGGATRRLGLHPSRCGRSLRSTLMSEPQPWLPPEHMPRWVWKAIAIFWLGYIVAIVTRSVWSSLSALFILLLVSLFLSLAIEPGVNRLAARGWRAARQLP